MSEPGRLPSPFAGEPPATGANGTFVTPARGLGHGPADQPDDPGPQATAAVDARSQPFPLAARKPKLPDSLIGTVVDGRYLIESTLGEGGMGVVYGARHRMIERKVALKVLKKELAQEGEILDRFVQEAKTATSIGNPHIVDILDFGIMPDGSTYFAMEHLEGTNLTALVGQRPPASRIAKLAMQVCDGLGAAHERGIVHRDLKPDNIFLIRRANDDFVKILDFGIAKVSGQTTGPKLTKAGAVFGTPHYMSPEQALGNTVDHRADIYALGVILYELAAGRLPFDGESFMGILTKHIYEVPVPVRALLNNGDCPAQFEAIIQKCLDKKRENRYQSCAELAADLERFLHGEEPIAVREALGRPTGSGNLPQDYLRAAGMGPLVPADPRRPRGAGAVVAVSFSLVALAAGLAAYTYRDRWLPGPGSAPTHVSADAAAPLPSPAPEPSAAPAPPALASEVEEVVLVSSAKGAVVVDGDTAKPLPATVRVQKGKPRSLVVRAPGFDSTVVDVDGTKPKVDVTLTKATTAAAGAPPPQKTAAPEAAPPKQPTAAPAPPSAKPSSNVLLDIWKKEEGKDPKKK